MYIIPRGVEYAIHGLEALTLTPFQRLRLAQDYAVHAWVAPAVHELLKSPSEFWTDDESDTLGPKSLVALAKAQKLIMRFRASLVAAPPLAPDPEVFDNPILNMLNDCTHHSTCREAWLTVWSRKIAPQIANPLRPLPFNGIVSLLIDTRHKGMNPDCKQNALAPLALTHKPKDYFTAYVDPIIDECISTIMYGCAVE